VHELRTDRYEGGDPDKTKPPTRVEDLWGIAPLRGAMAEPTPRRPHPQPPANALTDDDALTLYRAARDCMVAGAYTGATALLRRLILHVAVVQGNDAGTRQEAERLLGVAEGMLGVDI
jgi:hypothetical protein